MLPRTSAFNGVVSLLTQICTLLLGLAVLHPVAAQQYLPTPADGPTGAVIDGQALYCLGGWVLATAPTQSTQAFIIDLSVSWNTSNPAYKKLPDGPAGDWRSSTITSSGSWFTQTSGAGYIYSNVSGSWSTPFPDNPNFNHGQASRAVTNPDTGLLYLPLGSVVNNQLAMLVVNMVNHTFNSIPMLPGLITSMNAAVAWSAPLRSLVMFDGTVNGLYTYNSTNGWRNVTGLTKGTVPASRQAHCLVPAFGGSKLVLFGGITQSLNESYSDIHFLDVATLTWTRGPDLTQAKSRGGVSCGVSNGQLIAWGGSYRVPGFTAGYLGDAIVYDLVNNTWTSSYVSPSHASGSSTPSTTAAPSGTFATSDTSTGSGGGPGLAVILGAVIGVLVLVIAIGGTILLRGRAKHTKVTEHAAPSHKPSPESYDADKPVLTTWPTNDRLYGPEAQYYSPPPPAPAVADAYWADTYAQDKKFRGPAFIPDDHALACPSSPSIVASHRSKSKRNPQENIHTYAYPSTPGSPHEIVDVHPWHALALPFPTKNLPTPPPNPLS